VTVTEWRNCIVIGILSIALRIASDSGGCIGMCELTSDFVTCRVCKSPRQFNYRTKADAIVRRSSPSVLCVWICPVCIGRWDDFSTFAVRYPRENQDGFNPNSFVIFCFHSSINPFFFIHSRCIQFVIDRIPDELDILDSNHVVFSYFPAMACRQVKSGG